MITSFVFSYMMLSLVVAGQLAGKPTSSPDFNCLMAGEDELGKGYGCWVDNPIIERIRLVWPRNQGEPECSWAGRSPAEPTGFWV